jgi:hypothetical protein
MGSVAVLPRVLVRRTPFGTRVEWRGGSGLLARDAAGRCRPLAPDELRRQFPEAWPAWLRLAAMLPQGQAAVPGAVRRDGDEPWAS